jgi:hypothetical protein
VGGKQKRIGLILKVKEYRKNLRASKNNRNMSIPREIELESRERKRRAHDC